LDGTRQFEKIGAKSRESPEALPSRLSHARIYSFFDLCLRPLHLRFEIFPHF
jgi:hypothetical protein